MLILSQPARRNRDTISRHPFKRTFKPVQPHIQFYFIPNKKLAILWSPKCACGAIGNWAKAAIQEFEDFTIDADPHFGADARFNLNRRGYNFSLYNLKALIKTGNINIVAISVRDPVSRMHSAFINKFLIHQGNVLKNFSNLELFAKDFIKLASRTPQKGQHKPIKLRKRNDTFNISLAEFIKAIITGNREKSRISHLQKLTKKTPCGAKGSNKLYIKTTELTQAASY